MGGVTSSSRGLSSQSSANRYELLHDNVAWLPDEELLDPTPSFGSRPTAILDRANSSSRLSRFLHPVTSRFDRFFNFLISMLNRPAVCIIIIFVVFGVSLGLGLYALLGIKPSPVVDISVKAFNIPDHLASRRQDAYEMAMKDSSSTSGRRKRSVNDPFHAEDRPFLLDEFTNQSESSVSRSRRAACSADFPSAQTERRERVLLVYVARGNGLNVFTRDRLEMIHNLERKITELPGFSDFCFIEQQQIGMRPSSSCDCAPINSMLTYFYPSYDSTDKMWHYDGLGPELVDISEGLRVAMSKTANAYWYTDGRINSTFLESTLLRSEITLGAPLQGYATASDKHDEQKEKVTAFLASLATFLDGSSNGLIKVLYGGNELFDYQVNKTFWNDISLAIFAIVSIIIVVFILTSFSVWLTACGIITILLSFPLTFFFYRAVCGIVNVGMLSGVAAFVIVGIGVDDVFVFINTYRQCDHIKDTTLRLRQTIVTAGKSTFFTSFTTAAAFAANTLSSYLVIPADISQFLACSSNDHTVSHTPCTPLIEPLRAPRTPLVEPIGVGVAMNYVDDDVAMLKVPRGGEGRGMEGGGEGSSDSNDADEDNDNDDDPLLALEEQVRRQEEEEGEEGEKRVRGEGCGLSLWLQGFTYHYIAVNAIRGRYVITVLFVLILGASIGCMTQLHPATKPPQLFRPDTNLQMLLDLVANYSKQGLACDRCSGIYQNSDTVPLPTPPHTIIPPPTIPPPLPTIPPPSFQTRPLTLPSLPPVQTSPSYLSMPPTQSRSSATPRQTSSKPPTSTLITPSSSSSPASITIITAPPNYSYTTTITTNYRPPSITAGKAASTTSSSAAVPTASNRDLRTTTTTITTTTAMDAASPTLVLATSATTTMLDTQSSARQSSESATKLSTTAPLTAASTSAPSHPSAAVYPLAQSSPTPATQTPQVTESQFHPCANGQCDRIATHAPLEIGVSVHVVFGLRDIDRSNVTSGHVLSEKGRVIYDDQFSAHMSLTSLNHTLISELCRICLAIANNTQLVVPDSAQCLPSPYTDSSWALRRQVLLVPGCEGLPTSYTLNGVSRQTEAKAGIVDTNKNNIKITWLAFEFQSTTYKGVSSFSAYKQYQQWETFIKSLKDTLPTDSPLSTMYQTSDFWTQVMMEIVAVTSAIYGLVLSLFVCIAAVTIFTGHSILLFITIGSMIGMICLVVAIFYLAGWELGAIEAISLSILVGSSVDYCVHIVEGYLLAGRNLPPHIAESSDACVRQWRTKAAVAHIGSSVLSSALTTIIAAIPLSQAILLPFSRFGSIVAFNTAVSIAYSLTVCVALLAICAPARFVNGVRSTLIAMLCTIGVIGATILALYCAARNGVHIPGPNGADLFVVND